MSDASTIPISPDDSPSMVLELIYQLKIKDVMTGALITAKRGDSLRHIQGIMRDNYITGLPIAENLRLLGIVSIDDIVTALDKGYIDESAEMHMTRNVIVLEDDMPLSFAISYLNKFRFGRFPVLNKNRELVGIITSKDVIKALLVEMNREVLKLEETQRMNHAAPANDGATELEFSTTRYDFEAAGHASTEIKKALKGLELDPKLVRRIAVACYELEINQVVHSYGGTIRCSIRGDTVTIVAADSGPGIPNLDLALQEGWSTANEWIRSLGFGAGMGLTNTKRVSDEFFIESEVGTGTTVRSVIRIGEAAS
ncbi:MAG: histidine kinase [Treponema sp. GWB1_62_6]|nr:MAG: histidine kinase [Treponema sp. GWB1_62_6]OHE65224.1 MAG: histidine kinase [Treponema sp. GWC1_61_84]OHE75845.1 MAG: histidine kinase [Treponema sp. RIFOXYC1_FULL_61_9]HCM26425.1 histidine kinase [Treponema sp.]